MLALFLMTTMLLADSPRPVPIVAHRGESHDAPENTLASFGLAWERDDPTVETDIHLTSDGKLIISHDFDTERTTGTKLVIKDHTLAELRELSAGHWWKDPKWESLKLPTLEEVFQQMPPGKSIFVEIKIGPEAVPALKKAVEEAKRPAQNIVIISFKIDSCREAKKALPDHVVYYLVSQKQDKQTGKWTPTTEEMIKAAKDAGVDGLDIQAKACVDAKLVNDVHAAGLKLLVWTIDDLELAKKMRDLGVDGITTNRAAWMREQLKSGDAH
jgi:glycerophosphoryl diester phosphodiesterase